MPDSLIAACQNSKAGFGDIWQREEAFRQETVLLVVSVPVAFWLGTTLSQVSLTIVEILNSAIEAVVDRIGPELHELTRIAKDLGSAAVLLTALIPIFIWDAVILSRFGLIAL
jgi:diacylglycerol kinase (ATP)